MKNLMIAAVLALGTMTAFAQEETAVEETGTVVEETATEAAEGAEDTYQAGEEAATEAYDAGAETATEATEAVEESTEEVEASTEEAVEESTEEATEAVEESTEEMTEEVSAQDGFSEVATEDVPEAVTTALETAHPGATIDSAMMNEDSQYKLAVTTEAGESAELYMDAEGNMIEM